MSFADNDPTEPNFELSQMELAELHSTLAGTLLKHGQAAPNREVFSVIEGALLPTQFGYNLPAELIQETFYALEEDMIADRGVISYSTPHTIERGDGFIFETVYVSFAAILRDKSIVCHQSIYLAKSNDEYIATVDTEYHDTNTGTAVLAPPSLESIEVENGLVHGAISDLERPLMSSDATSLRSIEGFITHGGQSLDS